MRKKRTRSGKRGSAPLPRWRSDFRVKKEGRGGVMAKLRGRLVRWNAEKIAKYEKR